MMRYSKPTCQASPGPEHRTSIHWQINASPQPGTPTPIREVGGRTASNCTPHTTLCQHDDMAVVLHTVDTRCHHIDDMRGCIWNFPRSRAASQSALYQKDVGTKKRSPAPCLSLSAAGGGGLSRVGGLSSISRSPACWSALEAIHNRGR